MEAMVSGDGKTTSPVNLLTSARDLTGRFVQAFSTSSCSTQVKAVITVRYHVKVMKRLKL
jgi:hypothetical protein